VPATTQFRASTRSAFSYVTAGGDNDELFDTPQKQATSGFAVEACQQTLLVEVDDAQGRPVQDRAEQIIGQEVVCNSLGNALAARLLDVPYLDYNLYARRSFSFPGGGPDLPLFAVSQALYETPRAAGAVLR
jgi:hypothetical protein